MTDQPVASDSQMHGGHGRGWSARQLGAAAVVLLAAAAIALLIDLPLARFLKHHDLPGELQRLIRLSETFAWGGTVAILILAAAVLDRRGWRVAPWLVIGAFVPGAVADGVKLFVARLRPHAADLAGTVSDTFVGWPPVLGQRAGIRPLGHDIQSFPSGHAATAAGLAIALAALYPRGRWLFAGLALLAILQRLQSHSHFASDVLAGAALGCVCGAVQARLASVFKRCGAVAPAADVDAQ